MYDPDSFSIPDFPKEIDEQRPTIPLEKFSDKKLRDAKHGYYAMITDPDAYHDISSNPLYQPALAEYRHHLITHLLTIERPLTRTRAY